MPFMQSRWPSVHFIRSCSVPVRDLRFPLRADGAATRPGVPPDAIGLDIISS